MRLKKNKAAAGEVPATGDDAPKQGRKKLLLVGLVAMLAVSAGLYLTVFSGSADAAPVPGAVLALDAVPVNLAGGGYLKVGVALQFVEGVGGEGETLDGSRALDLVIAQFSQAAPADVATARDALKADLEQKIIAAYNGEVMGIYYTQYVTQ